MKIAFPLIDETELALDFSKSRNIGIYDDETDVLDVIAMRDENKETDIATLFQYLLNQNLKYIISPVCSFMSLRIFSENNLEALQAVGTNISENINLLKRQELKPFNKMDSFTRKSCDSACSSCKTECH